jgi:hypothetical protein
MPGLPGGVLTTVRPEFGRTLTANGRTLALYTLFVLRPWEQDEHFRGYTLFVLGGCGPVSRGEHNRVPPPMRRQYWLGRRAGRFQPADRLHRRRRAVRGLTAPGSPS